ncbi:hypothetical protein [Sphaerotilus mobilis]|nr:hypothetical protein [Sphaerotilus mobilis]
MKTLRLWRPLTRELHGLAADGSLELMTLSQADLIGLRADALHLVQALDEWQATHRPAATTHNPIQGT